VWRAFATMAAGWQVTSSCDVGTFLKKLSLHFSRKRVSEMCLIMGWNDHDDRLMEMADQFEMAGMEYTKAYEMALDIRQDEIREGEILSDMALYQIINDEMEES
jgi:hypothetical protein